MTLTLWDLIEPIRKRLRPVKPPAIQVLPPPAAPSKSAVQKDRIEQPTAAKNHASRGPGSARRGKAGGGPIPLARPASVQTPGSAGSPAASMQDRYDAVVRLMLDRYQIRVRKWRTGMSGVAWYVEYRDGRRQNLIESPRPKGPMSVAVFLHEIGHHAIGFNVYKPRCLEEYHAWRWALEAMASHDLNITDAVRYRMHGSLYYAVQKARRRGIKSIPAELAPYLDRPSKPKKAASTRSKK